MTTLLVNPEILSSFELTRIGVLIIENFNNQGKNATLLGLLRAEEENQRNLLASVELPSLPEIKAWRDAYRKFGSDPRDFRSSIEALLRRARAGNKPLPQINNLVDLYNYISLKYHVPVGAEDLDKTVGNIELAFASGRESGLTLGSAEPESCYPGEVIYRDSESYMCRRWNWREADRTKIEETTKRAVLVIDTVGGLGAEVLEKAINETQFLIQKELGGTMRSAILDPQNPSMSF